jgi:prephenate dehydrogenase
MRAALSCGAVSSRAGSLRELAAESDVLVLAAPLDATLAHLTELATFDRLPALTLDVASVKEPVARAAAGLAGFVATHPIAGSERSGVAWARADLFDGKMWAYDAHAAPECATRVEAFIVAMGATPLAIDPSEHDRVVALTSHLPQLVSVALGRRLDASLDSAVVNALCGTGMTSMLRLAGSSWTMWRAILAANAGPVAQEVRELAAILSGVAAALEAGRLDAVKDDFHAAARAAAGLDANVAARAAVHASTTKNDP